MVPSRLTMMEVLDHAIGTPEVGCLNLNLLFVCLKRLILHNNVRLGIFDEHHFKSVLPRSPFERERVCCIMPNRRFELMSIV